MTLQALRVIRHCFSQAAAALACLAVGMAPAVASELPVRWTTVGAVWSTPQQAVDDFLSTGAVTDRALDSGLNRAGWSPQEIREAMNKLYSVDLASVDRFLDSPGGQALLQGQTNTYYPYWSQGRTGVQALRAAILADAADGRISAATTMALLPTNMRLTPGVSQPLLAWWVFLPARIQGGAFNAPAAAGAPVAGAAAAPAGR